MVRVTMEVAMTRGCVQGLIMRGCVQGNEEQLKEVWEESDGLNKKDFDPRTFFYLHGELHCHRRTDRRADGHVSGRQTS